MSAPMISAALAVTAGVSFLAVNPVAKNIINPPPVMRSMALESLSYEGGIFKQQFKVSPEGILADWKASIKDVGETSFACLPQSGRGGYKTRATTFTIDEWVGPGCEANLIRGADYVGEASWEYIAEGGTIVTVTGTVRFTY